MFSAVVHAVLVRQSLNFSKTEKRTGFYSWYVMSLFEYNIP